MSLYRQGTATVTAGQRKVYGQNTAWAMARVAGSSFNQAGFSNHVESVQSDTELTLALPWGGPTNTGEHSIAYLSGGDLVASGAAALRDNAAGLRGLTPLARAITGKDAAAEMRALLEAFARDGSEAMTGALRVAGVARAIRAERAGFVSYEWHVVNAVRKWLTVNAEQWIFEDQSDDVSHRLGHDGAVWTKQIGDLATALAARFPVSGGTISGNFANSAYPGNGVYHLDVAPSSVTIAASGAFIALNFSGLMIVTNRGAGGSAIYLCGGGQITLIGQVGSHHTTGVFAPDQNGYAFFNGGPTASNFGIILQRTRQNA